MGAVLVTGAAGFVGSHLCEALLARGERVVGLDNLDPYYDPRLKRRNLAGLSQTPDFTFLEADVRDAAALADSVTAHAVDRIAHLAALAGVRASVQRAADYAAVNVSGTINVLEAARLVGAGHTVLASTSSVYGGTARVPFVEEDAADRPLAPYPATKRAAELMAHAYFNLFGLPIAVVRLFSVYGPRGRPDMMPYQVARGIVRDRPITLFDRGRMRRDWTYVADVVAGIVGALDHPDGFAVYNLGRGEPVRMADFVEILEGLIGRRARIDHAPAPASEPPITYADISRARAAFGYNPRVPVADGLKAFWEWFRSVNDE